MKSTSVSLNIFLLISLLHVQITVIQSLLGLTIIMAKYVLFQQVKNIETVKPTEETHERVSELSKIYY